LGPDGDEAFLHVSCLLVTHGSGSVGHGDQVTEGVYVAVGPADTLAVSALFLSDVGLPVVVGHFEVESVLGIIIEHLSKCACTDLSDFLG